VVAGQRQILAGASLPIQVGIANVMHFAGVGLDQAVAMATHHPAGLLGIRSGDLIPGEPADAVLFDLVGNPDGQPPTIQVRATLVGGQVVWGSVA
jgi:N-acetylglucosamine-6-phosphate deacetylase